MHQKTFSPTDLESLKQREISPDEAHRQLAQLRRHQAFLPIERPCLVGDGLARITPEEIDPLCRLFDTATDRITRFVPASGAATRMFEGLSPMAGDQDAIARLRRNLHKFPFYPDLTELTELLPEDLDDANLVALILDQGGLELANRPKGLLPLHRGRDYDRTAFAEHLHESCAIGVTKFHFTVSPEHLELFRQQSEQITATLSATGKNIEINFSIQASQTDTIALDLQDESPFVTTEGELLLRPAGHGALLHNLENCAGDLVLIRNIDNVVPENRQEPYRLWARVLGGKLTDLQQQVFALLEQLAGVPDPATVQTAKTFLRQTFGRNLAGPSLSLSEESTRLIALLDRPIRVCGMVPVSGQPGGGPFWARDALGQVSPQIVEGAQIDPGERQQQILAASTHFNPVNIACSLRDRTGKPYRLDNFVDAQAVILTRKNHAGRDLLALERPGLWNGAMSGWNSLFIEMPTESFNPIKTVFDLLQPSHQVD